MSLSLPTQKADSFRFAPHSENTIVVKAFWEYVRSSELRRPRGLPKYAEVIQDILFLGWVVGWKSENGMREFPYLTDADSRACLAYAADRERKLELQKASSCCLTRICRRVWRTCCRVNSPDRPADDEAISEVR